MRKVGREAEAQKEQEKIDRLALGNVRAMRWIARAYASCGAFEKAGERGWRVALETTGDTQEFIYAAEAVLDDAKERGDWKLAASMGEIQMLDHLMIGDRSEQPWVLLRSRIETEMARALSLMDQDRSRAIEMLERCHSRGDREKALKWSAKALLNKPGETTLVRQHKHFRSDDFPLK